jgi:hypothetical protein
LIYELIVAQLRNIKQNRQVIVVTYNANIVVNGDAELVMALGVRALCCLAGSKKPSAMATASRECQREFVYTLLQKFQELLIINPA